MTTPIQDPELEGFLALIAARRSPRTVEAYRRDLTALGAYLGKPIAAATLEELERYTAQLRADGLSPATIARRTAAARSFFKHQQLLGARADNPAAGPSSCGGNWPTRPASTRSACTPTSSGTRLRRTCSREEQTCGRFRKCSAMPICRLRSSIRT